VSETLVHVGAPEESASYVPVSGRGARVRSGLSTTALYVACIGVALGLSAALVAATGGSPSSVFTAMYDGSVNGWGSFGYTLDNATPLLIVAIGTVVAVRAGFFNIGQEGQLAIGAMTGGLVALKLGGPGPLVLILALAASAVGGAIWAGIPALLRFWRGIDVVISSLLLIFIAFQVLSYALNNSWFLQEQRVGRGAVLNESDQVSSHVRLPHYGAYPGLNFGSGLVIGIVLAVVVAVLMARSRWGFKLRMLGLNPVVARRAGVSAFLIGGTAVMISGAFAGLAGGVVLTSQAYRLTPTFSNNVGWNGLLVALIARQNAALAIPVALFFGALQAGGSFLSTLNVSTDLTNIVQALLVLAVVFPTAFRELQRYRRGRAQALAGAAGTAPAAVGA
jgi:ABC-type uncharacterized transport system permease subunit